MTRILLKGVIFVLIATLLFVSVVAFNSCGGEKGPRGLQGEKGETGEKGDDGLTPYIKDGTWWIGDEDTGIKATGDAGAEGEKGEKGDDGLTPYIKDGTWWIGDEDTGIKATGDAGAEGETGEKGDDGLTPYIKDGTWWIGDEDTGIKATGDAGAEGEKGDDGLTPYIKDGNWWIGNEDTGIKATGDAGADGLTPYIKDGNWWIDDEDTGIKATGDAGAEGLSAYEIYVKNNPDYTGTEAEWIAAYINGTLNTHTVTFDLNGGDAPEGFEASVTAYDRKTIALTVPTRVGYTFLGWYTGTTPVDGIFTTTDMVTGDMNLIAVWQINQVTVTFLDYYGDTMEIQTVDYGTDAVAPAVPNTIGDSYFQGWSRILTDVTEDMTVQAVYCRKKYTLTYYVNEDTVNAPVTYQFGDIPEQPEDPEVYGYIFEGWYLDRAFETEYLFDYALNTNMTLYAKMAIDYTDISTAEELTAIANEPRGMYRLVNDIDYGGATWTPIDTFSGLLNGNGYRIYNMQITSTGASAGVALIRTNTGTLQNVVLEEFTFTDTYVYPAAPGSSEQAIVNHPNYNNNYTSSVMVCNNQGTIDGCIVRNGTITLNHSFKAPGGTAYGVFGIIAGSNAGTVINCTINAEAIVYTSVHDSYNYAAPAHIGLDFGGIVGENSNVVKGCISEATVKVVSTGSRKNDTYSSNHTYIQLGGIVGDNEGTASVVSECQATVDFDMEFSGVSRLSYTYELYAGAIVGENSGSIANCLGYGTIDATNSGDKKAYAAAGGISGKNFENACVTSSYADVDITIGSKVDCSAGGIVGNNITDAKIEKSVFVGNIMLTDSTGKNSGMITGQNLGTVTDCYYSDASVVTMDGTAITPNDTAGVAETLEVICTNTFIFDTLGWNSAFWSIVDGQAPILK